MRNLEGFYAYSIEVECHSVRGLATLQVERLSGLIEMPVEKMCTDDIAAQQVRQDIINSSVNIDKRLTKMYDLLENDLLGSLQIGIHYIAPYKGESMLKASVALVPITSSAAGPSSSAAAGTSSVIDLTGSSDAEDPPLCDGTRSRQAIAEGRKSKRDREVALMADGGGSEVLWAADAEGDGQARGRAGLRAQLGHGHFNDRMPRDEDVGIDMVLPAQIEPARLPVARRSTVPPLVQVAIPAHPMRNERPAIPARARLAVLPAPNMAEHPLGSDMRRTLIARNQGQRRRQFDKEMAMLAAARGDAEVGFHGMPQELDALMMDRLGIARRGRGVPAAAAVCMVPNLNAPAGIGFINPQRETQGAGLAPAVPTATVAAPEAPESAIPVRRGLITVATAVNEALVKDGPVHVGSCPICGNIFTPQASNEEVNVHLDKCLAECG